MCAALCLPFLGLALVFVCMVRVPLLYTAAVVRDDGAGSMPCVRATRSVRTQKTCQVLVIVVHPRGDCAQTILGVCRVCLRNKLARVVHNRCFLIIAVAVFSAYMTFN